MGYVGVEKHHGTGFIFPAAGSEVAIFDWYAEFFRQLCFGTGGIEGYNPQAVVVRGGHKPFQLLWVGGEIAGDDSRQQAASPVYFAVLPGNIYYAPCYGRCRQHYKEHGYQLVIGHALGNVIVQKGGEENTESTHH